MPTHPVPGLAALALAFASAAVTVGCSSEPQQTKASKEEWRARVAAAHAHAARNNPPAPKGTESRSEPSRDGDARPAGAARPPTRRLGKPGEASTPGDTVVTIVTSPVSDETARARAKDAVQVVMYATSWCGVCTLARSYLRAEHIRFVEHDVERDAAARKRHRTLNPKGSVPTISVDGRVMVGFGEDHFDAMYDEAIRSRAANRKPSGPMIIEVGAQSAPRDRR